MTHEEMIEMLKRIRRIFEYDTNDDIYDRDEKINAIDNAIAIIQGEIKRAAEPTEIAETAETTEYIRGCILDEAKQIVTEDRNKQYGPPEDNFAKIGDLWSAYLGREISAHDVAIMMTLFKIGRIETSDKRDSYVDACGYMACAGEINEKLLSPEK